MDELYNKSKQLSASYGAYGASAAQAGAADSQTQGQITQQYQAINGAVQNGSQTAAGMPPPAARSLAAPTAVPAQGGGVAAQPSGGAPAYGGAGGGQSQNIAGIYDAQRNLRLSQLEQARAGELATYEQALKDLPGQYQTQANDIAAQYERQRRNFNQQAAANGLNTGAASQAQLAQNSVYQRDYANLRTAQADAEAAVQQKMRDVESQYKFAVAQAIAENDLDKAKALYDEEQRVYGQNLQRAQLLAQYGDFSGYASIYGDDIASNMTNMWNAQNPDLAYRTGRIGAAQYYQMTGKYPEGYSAPGGGPRRGPGGGGGGEEEVDEIYRRSLYGDDVSYIVGEMAYERHNAYAEGEKAAKAAGLTPGSAEYARYADLYSQSALADNARYQTLSEKNADRAAQSAAVAQANYEKQKVEEDEKKRTEASEKLVSGGQGESHHGF